MERIRNGKTKIQKQSAIQRKSQRYRYIRMLSREFGQTMVAEINLVAIAHNNRTIIRDLFPFRGFVLLSICSILSMTGRRRSTTPRDVFIRAVLLARKQICFVGLCWPAQPNANNDGAEAKRCQPTLPSFICSTVCSYNSIRKCFFRFDRVTRARTMYKASMENDSSGIWASLSVCVCEHDRLDSIASFTKVGHYFCLLIQEQFIRNSPHSRKENRFARQNIRECCSTSTAETASAQVRRVNHAGICPLKAALAFIAIARLGYDPARFSLLSCCTRLNYAHTHTQTHKTRLE